MEEREAREDLISKLPDSLLSEMISYLPTTKDIVRTSVLSKRWKSVWLLIPRLHLDSCEFPNYNAFVSFMDKFLDFSREHKLGLHSLRLSLHKDANDLSCVTRWKDFLAIPQLKHLDVECLLVNRECFQVTSLSLCEKLLYLRLHRVHLGRFVVAVSLPCLKTMRLEDCFCSSEASLESLISSCPVLEDLSILRINYNTTVLRVHSQTLTSFTIYMVELKYLSFVGYAYAGKTIISSSSLTKVNILGDFQVKDDEVARNFFTSISIARDMKISVKGFLF
ncbi:PREDICTED: putative FBD-associated F-box protein At5g22720 [Camelina sativa]|uniref:FBD-associated F-box protein At5g22720 n=1 Tax=Camelina sativa TaxID=90675 RepID=A0ABM1R9J5_CAMSA|nr:PREDICTED: putative FBD-associated F-box protein At5g22720 [Camelina sativa]XP_019095683.1 PREDICTED: putative FBD-associated F-box protein At5g22720 [Camelina sativa]